MADSGDLEIFEDSGPAVRDLERNKSGLEASFSGPALLSTDRSGPYPWIPPVLFYLILLGPAVLWLLLYLRKIRVFGRRRHGAAEFRKFLKTWKKDSAAGRELSLKTYETALGGFMETEIPTPGRGIYGYEEELESSPEGLEAYRIIREILDRGLYAPSSGNGESDDKKNKELTTAGEVLLKEMLK
ncbi:MAG: hypothetical protein JEY99_19435 [Spirochaetales bacterium]|nr:hypothetical protein [Spirochaetales bacterium]